MTIYYSRWTPKWGFIGRRLRNDGDLNQQLYKLLLELLIYVNDWPISLNMTEYCQNKLYLGLMAQTDSRWLMFRVNKKECVNSMPIF